MEVYDIILQQLGGNMFVAMTGAKLFHDGDKFIAKIKGSKQCNHIEISLNGMDLYDIRFCKIGTVKTFYEVKNDHTLNNIYFDDMKKLIEEETKLCLSL